MPRALINVAVPDVRDKKKEAVAAAEGIATIIGDQAQPWRVSIYEPVNESGWRVEVTGPEKTWTHTFDGSVNEMRDDIVAYFSRALGS